jgi:hypothetical protein
MAWCDRGVGRCRGSWLVEAAVWWVLLFAGYLMLVSPLSGGEFLLGALLSAVAALQLLGPLIGRFKPVMMTIVLHVAM